MIGVILAGGQATRMNGQNKSLLEVNGVPIIERQLNEMRLICERVCVVTNESSWMERFLYDDVFVVSDRIEKQGPLVGLWSALEAFDDVDLVWLVGGDMPYIDSKVASELASQLKDATFQAAILTIQGKQQPLHAVYRASVRGLLNEMIEQGVRSFHCFIQNISSQVVEEDVFRANGWDIRCVTNWNEPSDLLLD